MRDMDKNCSLVEVDFSALHSAVDRAVASFIRNCSDANPNHKTGGVLLHRSNRGVEQHTGVGTITRESVLYDDFLATARRKIKQLRLSFKYCMTSYESRDPENGLWGGGLNISCYGQVALSGLPELADEACLLCGLVVCDLVDYIPFAIKVLSVSDNTELYNKIMEGMVS